MLVSRISLKYFTPSVSFSSCPNNCGFFKLFNSGYRESLYENKKLNFQFTVNELFLHHSISFFVFKKFQLTGILILFRGPPPFRHKDRLTGALDYKPSYTNNFGNVSKLPMQIYLGGLLNKNMQKKIKIDIWDKVHENTPLSEISTWMEFEQFWRWD